MSKEQKKNNYKIGDKVWLIHLRESAVITRIEKKGVLYVNAGGMEIPVFIHDIKPFKEIEKSPKQMSSINGSEVSNELYKFDQKKLSQRGVLLLFIPESLNDGEIIHYDVFLVNDTREPIQFIYKLSSTHGIFEQGEHHLKATTHTRLTHFKASHINEIQFLECKILPDNAEFIEEHIQQKFNASSLVRHQCTYEPVQREVFLYELLKQYRVKPKEKDYFTSEDESFEIDASHIRSMMHQHPTQKEDEVIIPEKEVDLHIEKVTNDTRSLTNTDILLMQLEHFRKSLDRAIRSGQKEFYAIHGNGSGKLKKEIHHILKTHSQVTSFTDDFTPKYGFGATKITLK